MSWLELDDRILEHPKFVRAVKIGGSEAIHMWLGLRAYCGQLLTDGAIPSDMVDEVKGPRHPAKRSKAMSALVEVGLVHRTEDGFQLHDYADWSASREEIMQKRAIGNTRSALRANAELMKAIKLRDGDQCRYCGVTVDWKDRRGQNGGTYDHVVPLSKGGTNDIDNIVVACRRCNAAKCNRPVSEFAPSPYREPTGRDLAVAAVKPSSTTNVLSSPLLSSPIHSGGRSDSGVPAQIPDRQSGSHRIARVGTVTPAFLAVYDRYPNREGKLDASQVFAEIADTFDGGEQELSKAILASFGGGKLSGPAYDNEPRYRLTLKNFLAGRRWEDAPSDPAGNAPRRDPVLDEAIKRGGGRPYLPPEKKVVSSGS